VQGKGGVGKSLVASLLAQYIRDGLAKKGRPADLLRCYDTDPVNQSFAAIPSLNAEQINITEDDGLQVDEMRFDTLLEKLFGQPDVGIAVIDNGASCFLSLCNYLKTGNVFDILQSGYKHRGYLHTVVIGGTAFQDTVRGLDSLCRNFPGVPVILWKNLFYGPLEGKKEQDGEGRIVRLEESHVWQSVKKTVEGVITIPHAPPQTTGKDLSALYSRNATFHDAVNDPSLPLMTRHRLYQYRNQVMVAINKALWEILDFGDYYENPAWSGPED
jgi:hypothetical protein